MNAHEHTDPHGDGLTITHDDGKMWITCTTAHAEVTVGPLAPIILTDYDMDGGVAAALIEKEAEEHGAAAPCPLTPDAITDEMVDRAWRAYRRDVPASREGLRRAITAALTVPTRPDGAEELEAILSELPDTMLPATDAGRADLLASRGVRAPEDGAA